MRVLLLNFEYPPIGGGAGYATQNLLREYAKAGLAVDVITSAWAHKDAVERLGATVRVFRLDVRKRDIHYWRASEVARWTWRAWRLMRRLRQKHRYDAVHAFFTYPCGALAWATRLPYLVSVRGFDVPGFNARLSWLDALNTPLVRAVWRGADAVVANSEGLKALALKTAPTQRIDVVYNGINTQEFFPKGWAMHGSASSISGDAGTRNADTSDFVRMISAPGPFSKTTPMKLLCVSRLIPRKGVHHLIEAMRLLKDKPITLTVVGEGDQAGALKAQARGFAVTFLDYVKHEALLPIYQAHDVFVLPSENEGMSNTVLEAMACGLPIVATRTGGTDELVADNGLVLKNSKAKTIAAAFTRFLDHPDLIASMGPRSRQRAEELGWDRIAAQYIACYRDIAKSPA